jgi:hypothetical protein
MSQIGRYITFPFSDILQSPEADTFFGKDARNGGIHACYKKTHN